MNLLDDVFEPVITTHKFPYKWTLKDAVFTKDKGNVFSCFACGGGSTMGYKLAGFDVLGCNEIDPRMMKQYIANHHPKYSFLEPIQTFKDRQNLPQELYHLDILDGSPPCSSFSMAGNRYDDWGKEKVFKEGQAKQILDTLFFDFIDLAEKLQPKVVVAENVKGLILGRAYEYFQKIHKAFDRAGYSTRAWLLDASKMGVPQKRERVFVIALRKDLVKQMNWVNENIPELDLNFNEPQILFGDVRSEKGSTKGLTNWTIERLNKLNHNDGCISDINEREFGGKVSRFNAIIISDDELHPTLTSSEINYRRYDKMACSDEDNISVQTFPQDYNFNQESIKYICGMSVPPVMTAQIATRIYDQWLSKL